MDEGIVYKLTSPEPYEGYAVVNHPKLKNKYFQKKSLSNEEKLTLAMQYLSMGEVHRPNGNGSLNEA